MLSAFSIQHSAFSIQRAAFGFLASWLLGFLASWLLLLLSHLISRISSNGRGVQLATLDTAEFDNKAVSPSSL
jgi:hypothetical protein